MKWLYKLEYKMRGRAIPNLIVYILAMQLLVYLFDAVGGAQLLGLSATAREMIALDRSLVFQGQVWRLITFIFEPTGSTPVSVLFSILIYYMIGSALERAWGEFMFNAYYFIGMIGVIIAAMVTGYGVNYYLHLSMFFAYAILYPDEQFRLYFLIPIKAKYLAIVDAIFYVISLVSAIIVFNWPDVACMVMSLVNLLFFFWKNLRTQIRTQAKYRKTRQNFRSQMRDWDRYQRS